MLALVLITPGAPIRSTAQAQRSATNLVIVNNSPSIRGGSTIYDKTGRQSLQIWGEDFCTGAGCTVETEGSFYTSAAKPIGIQWNIYRVASDMATCDNPCRQIELDLDTCTTTLKTDGYCYEVHTPRWTPDLTTTLKDGTCTITVTNDSKVDANPDGSEPQACGCEWGAAPCQCGDPFDSKCSGVCPISSSSACGSNDEGDCTCPQKLSLQTEPSQSLNLHTAVSPKVTVKNNCGDDTTVVFGGAQIESCTDEDCGTRAESALNDGQNVQLYIGPSPFDKFSNNNFGAATLAELKMDGDDGVWADISRVSGFNKGVTIEDDAKAWRLTCNGVNCNDAYWLCDNGEGNKLFSPNAKFATTALTITFCPDGDDDTDYFASSNKCGDKANPRAQDAQTSAPYICQWNDHLDISSSGTCVTGQLSADGKYCEGATPKAVQSCDHA